MIIFFGLRETGVPEPRSARFWLPCVRAFARAANTSERGSQCGPNHERALGGGRGLEGTRGRLRRTDLVIAVGILA